VDFFLRGVAEQARDALERTRRLLDLWETYRKQVSAGRASALQLRLIDALFEKPVISVPQTARLLGVTDAAARKNVEKLVGAGILTEARSTRPRLYLAQDVFRVVDAPLD
jgi:Fic family protein